MAYSAKTTEVTLTYTPAVTSVDVTKSLQYLVTTTHDLTKNIIYEVQTENDVLRALTYTVATNIDVTKNLVYSIILSPSVDETRDLGYCIVKPIQITKPLAYSITASKPITKALKYCVISPNEITKTIDYVVNAPTSVLLDIDYRILKVRDITKSLTYAMTGQTYSRESSPVLPSISDDLSPLYTPAEYENVASDDDVYTDQSGVGVLLHEFKVRPNQHTKIIKIRWQGQSTVAPSVIPVVMQVFNWNSSTWETLASNGTESSNTDFDLYAEIRSNLTNYYNTSDMNTIAVRIYQ